MYFSMPYARETYFVIRKLYRYEISRLNTYINRLSQKGKFFGQKSNKQK